MKPSADDNSKVRNIRFPRDLFDWIWSLARANGRMFSTQVIWLLRELKSQKDEEALDQRKEGGDE